MLTARKLPSIVERAGDPYHINSILDLIPTDGLNDNATRLGPASATLFRQRLENHRGMLALSKNLSDADIEVIRCAADLSLACHARHVRGGDKVLHYSSHLLAVAQRVDKNYRETGETFYSPTGEKVSSRAVAIAAAILHDTEEDIEETIGQIHSRFERFEAVEVKLRSAFKSALDAKGIERLASAVRTLSIKNRGDIPDSEYVEGIEHDFMCLQIKEADIDHNMITMPDYAPTYGAVVVPAQFGDLMDGSPYSASFRRQVCACALRIFRGADYSREPQTPGEEMVQKLLRFEGEVVGPRLIKFYDSLIDEIKAYPKSTLLPEGKKATTVIKALEDFKATLSVIGADSLPTKQFPIRDIETEQGGIRVLGPVNSWCGTLKSNCTEKELEDAILLASQELNTRISGFITNDGITVGYQMNRWPRRMGEEVPAADDYERSIKCIAKHLTAMGMVSEISINPQSGQNRFQSLLGLEEGYFEGRKSNLLLRIDAGDIKSSVEAVDVFREEIGSPEDFGIVLTGEMSLDAIQKSLKSKSLAKLHELPEVRQQIGENRDINLIPARIFSVNFESGYRYEEPAVLLDGSPDSNLPRAISRIAIAFHQARVSVQWSREIPEAYNLEFGEAAQNAAAKLR